MEKIKNNCIYFIIFIIIFSMVASIILLKPLNNLDEIWNYNFAKNMADGLIPYLDFNIVTTPLLPFICAIFLKLFGNELWIMRILACFLISGIFLMIYFIEKKLKINSFFSFLILFFFFFILKDSICIDYNFSILFIVLILIYLELNYNFKNKIFYFSIGLLCGICILLKQSTGSVISFISILYPILFVKNKMDFKNYFKNTLFKILGILIPVILLIIYLLLNGAFYHFIDYAILGIGTFQNSISYFSLINSNNLLIKILSILMPIFILSSGFYIWKKQDKNFICFYAYAIASLIVIYPIADPIHFLIGITPFLILFFYFIFQFLLWIKNKLKLKNNKIINHKPIIFIKEALKCFFLLLFIYYFINQLLLFENYFKHFPTHTLKHFENIPISSNLLDKINTVNDYILLQNDEVYILDAEAAIYMISLNKYHKNFDMFNKGNFGSKGENGIIEEIKQFPKGTKLFIKNKQYAKNWQTPMEVISFVENTYPKIGEISIFDIYEIQ